MLKSVCSLAAWLSMHDVRSAAAKRCDGIRATTDRHSEWASLSALVFSVITWTPGQMVRAEGSGFGVGEGPPCAFHLLTGSLSPLPALFSIAWTNTHTDNFTSRKVWVLACICVCMYKCCFNQEILAFYVICFFFISGCFNTTIALLFESLHGEALGSAFFYFNSY